MEQYDRVGRPTQPVSRDVNGAPAPQASSSKKPKFKINGQRALSVLLIAFVAIILIGLIVLIVNTKSSGNAVSSQIQNDKIQAVFLNSSDGQVYFGKLTDLNNSYYQLSEIYYVRVNQAVQPDKTKAATPDISLAKLGSEIHGPQDIMYINKSSVMFWENLKEDGQVVCAVRDYQINTLKMTGVKKSDKCNAAANTTPTPAPTAAPTPTPTARR